MTTLTLNTNLTPPHLLNWDLSILIQTEALHLSLIFKLPSAIIIFILEAKGNITQCSVQSFFKMNKANENCVTAHKENIFFPSQACYLPITC